MEEDSEDSNLFQDAEQSHHEIRYVESDSSYLPIREIIFLAALAFVIWLLYQKTRRKANESASPDFVSIHFPPLLPLSKNLRYKLVFVFSLQKEDLREKRLRRFQTESTSSGQQAEETTLPSKQDLRKRRVVSAAIDRGTEPNETKAAPAVGPVRPAVTVSEVPDAPRNAAPSPPTDKSSAGSGPAPAIPSFSPAPAGSGGGGGNGGGGGGDGDDAWLHRTLCNALEIPPALWPQVRAQLGGEAGDGGDGLLNLFHLLPGPPPSPPAPARSRGDGD